MTIDGSHFDALTAELDSALRDLVAAADRDPGLWGRGKPGKWTAGQHVEHVALCMAAMADGFEARGRLPAGEWPARPGRGLLESLWIAIVVKGGKLPRGGKTRAAFEPGALPDRATTIGSLRRESDRIRALGAGHAAEDRDRLWIANPFMARWHYTLPETARVNAVHARHHAKLIRGLR